MYLDWVNHLGLLQEPMDSNVLQSFPGDVRYVVVSAVAMHLVSQQNRKFLRASAHVQWAMEILAHGFTLPMENANVIEACLSVYQDWLQGAWFPNDAIPDSVAEDPEMYYRLMFEHLSLLFVPREPGAEFFGPPERALTKWEALNRHTELCGKTLDLIHAVGRSSVSAFTPGTWATLLKLLMGIADSLLHRPLAKPRPEDDLAGRLCPHLLRVLFDLWLHSCVHCYPSPELWSQLRKLCERWRHRKELVLEWNSVCLALTQRVLRILYGPENGSEAVIAMTSQDALGGMGPEGNAGKGIPGGRSQTSDTGSPLENPTSQQSARSGSPSRILGGPMSEDSSAQPGQNNGNNGVPAAPSSTGAPQNISTPTSPSPSMRAGTASTRKPLLKPLREPITPMFADAGFFMPDRAATHAWYQMLHTIGNPNHFNDPVIHLAAIEGVSELVEVFLRIKPLVCVKDEILPNGEITTVPAEVHEGDGTVNPIAQGSEMAIAVASMASYLAKPAAQSQSTGASGSDDGNKDQADDGVGATGGTAGDTASSAGQQPQNSSTAAGRTAEQYYIEIWQASGNALLHVFGSDLFEASSMGKLYEQGRSLALATLCRIFASQRATDRLHLPYLARFYHSVHRGLEKDGLAASTILLESTELFHRRLQGSKLLIPNILRACKSIMMQTTPTFTSTEVYNMALTYHHISTLQLFQNCRNLTRLKRASLKIILSLHGMFVLQDGSLTIPQLNYVEKIARSEQNSAVSAGLVNSRAGLYYGGGAGRVDTMASGSTKGDARGPPTIPDTNDDQSTQLSDAGTGAGNVPVSPMIEIQHRVIEDMLVQPATAPVNLRDSEMSGPPLFGPESGGDGSMLGGPIPPTSDPPSLAAIGTEEVASTSDLGPSASANVSRSQSATKPTRNRSEPVSPVPDDNGSGISGGLRGLGGNIRGRNTPNLQRRAYMGTMQGAGEMVTINCEDLLELILTAMQTITGSHTTDDDHDVENWQLLIYAFEAISLMRLERHIEQTANGIKLITRRLREKGWPLSVTLVALETLEAFSKQHEILQEQAPSCARMIVRDLCFYIDKQISQPLQRHTKSLHSMIAAAYHTILGWIITDDQWILRDQRCMLMLMEIIEYGMTGSKSQKSRPGLVLSNDSLNDLDRQVKKTIRKVSDNRSTNSGAVSVPVSQEERAAKAAGGAQSPQSPVTEGGAEGPGSPTSAGAVPSDSVGHGSSRMPQSAKEAREVIAKRAASDEQGNNGGSVATKGSTGSAVSGLQLNSALGALTSFGQQVAEGVAGDLRSLARDGKISPRGPSRLRSTEGEISEGNSRNASGGTGTGPDRSPLLRQNVAIGIGAFRQPSAQYRVRESQVLTSYTDSPSVPKEKKLAHPPSRRVKDAAECLFLKLFSQLGHFPSAVGPSITGSLIDEAGLLAVPGLMGGSTGPSGTKSSVIMGNGSGSGSVGSGSVVVGGYRNSLRQSASMRSSGTMRRSQLKAAVDSQDEEEEIKLAARIRYFVVDSSVILAVVERPDFRDVVEEQALGEDGKPDPDLPPAKIIVRHHPAATVIIRDACGKHGWTGQLRYLPERLRIDHCDLPAVRPDPMSSDCFDHFMGAHLPELDDGADELDAVCWSEACIPPLQRTATDRRAGLQEGFFGLMNRQAEMEGELHTHMARSAVQHQAPGLLVPPPAPFLMKDSKRYAHAVMSQTGQIILQTHTNEGDQPQDGIGDDTAFGVVEEHDPSTKGADTVPDVGEQDSAIAAATDPDTSLGPLKLGGMKSTASAKSASVVSSPAPTLDVDEEEEDVDGTRRSNSLVVGRILLSHLGLLHESMIGPSKEKGSNGIPRVSELKCDRSLLRSLRDLDEMPDRECLTSSILYVSSGTQSVQDALQCEVPSREFAEFVQALGWTMNLESHVGYRGHLPRYLRCLFPYYADFEREMVFHAYPLIASTLKFEDDEDGDADLRYSIDESVLLDEGPAAISPSTSMTGVTAASATQTTAVPTIVGRQTAVDESSSRQLQRRLKVFERILRLDKAAVIWLDDSEDRNQIVNSMKSSQRTLVIVIHALGEGLYRIELSNTGPYVVNDSRMIVGPLVHGMVLDKASLAPLVRLTLINNANRERLLLDNNPGNAIVQRKKKIEELEKRYKKPHAMADFFEDFFR
eukprot:Clim_evm4s46 gene=Clim_evmTU4s46